MKMKYTKIVATVAGCGCTEELIRDLYERGMNVVRFNTAHMSTDEFEKCVRIVRSVSPYLAIMVDTKGPNTRTCGVERPIEVKKGERILLSGVPAPRAVTVNYATFADEVPVGSRIVCDDGAAAFDVIAKEGTSLVVEARFDSVIRDRKSINVPNVSLKAPTLTDKDRAFIAEAVRLGIDFIAHSFVRNAADVVAVRKELGEKGKDIAIISKIENREGVDNLDEILEASDGIMVARGDLGIEIPLEELPAIQKMMIRKCMEKAKPVITATQMLQSMEASPVPTRAEVSDVANAVYDGTDAVMLSGETAHGRFPREAVEMMSRIVMQAENAENGYRMKLEKVPESRRDTSYIINAAVGSCDYLPIKSIVCATLTGTSARLCSATRKRVPIVASTPNEFVMRQLSLSYGVFPALAEFSDDPIRQASGAISVVRPYLQDDDLVMLLGKHSPVVARNNLCCLTRLADLEDFRR